MFTFVYLTHNYMYMMYISTLRVYSANTHHCSIGRTKAGTKLFNMDIGGQRDGPMLSLRLID